MKIQKSITLDNELYQKIKKRYPNINFSAIVSMILAEWIRKQK